MHIMGVKGVTIAYTSPCIYTGNEWGRMGGVELGGTLLDDFPIPTHSAHNSLDPHTASPSLSQHLLYVSRGAGSGSPAIICAVVSQHGGGDVLLCFPSMWGTGDGWGCDSRFV